MSEVLSEVVGDTVFTEVETQDKASVHSAAQDSVGARLAASREQHRWTIPYVAEQLKLSQGQILALEQNRLQDLPKLVIVRGFVRAYAKLLRVDGDALVAMLPRDETPVQLEASLRPALSTPFIDSRSSLSGQHDTNRRYLMGALALIVLVALFLLGQKFDVLTKLSQWTKPATVETAASPEQAVLVPAPSAELVASAPVPMAEPMPSPDVTSPAGAPVMSESVPTPVTESIAKSSENAVVKDVAPVLSLPPAHELLVIKFRQDSWIYVKTEKGQVLSSHLAKAGTEESFSVKQTLFLKIGNAAGVEASLRGEPMAIVADRGSNVANLLVK